MLMEYRVVLVQSEEGFSVSCPALRGCHSQGSTMDEALENIKSAIREWLDAESEKKSKLTVIERTVRGTPFGRSGPRVGWRLECSTSASRIASAVRGLHAGMNCTGRPAAFFDSKRDRCADQSRRGRTFSHISSG